MIIRSPFVGKSTKKLGEAAYYVRKGVQCARALSPRKENYKPSVAQAMQQRVFKFLKANYDANALSIFVRMYCDAKPKSGRSQTAYNLFYAAIIPSLVAQKSTLYGLAADELVNGWLLLNGATKMTEGVLGVLPILTAASDEITISEAVFNEVLAKANAQLSADAIPFTSEDVQVGYVSSLADADADNSGLLVVNSGSFVTPSIASNVVTLPITGITPASNATGNAIFFVRFAKKGADGNVDPAYPTFAFDSFAMTEATEDRPTVQ